MGGIIYMSLLKYETCRIYRKCNGNDKGIRYKVIVRITSVENNTLFLVYEL